MHGLVVRIGPPPRPEREAPAAHDPDTLKNALFAVFHAMPAADPAHYVRGQHEGYREITGVAPEAMKALVAYSWPGNVRELENRVKRAVIESLSETRQDEVVRDNTWRAALSGSELLSEGLQALVKRRSGKA